MNRTTMNPTRPRLPNALWMLAVLCLGLSGCGLLEVNPDKPADDIRGAWTILSVNTQTYDADGTVLTDETVTNMGTLQFDYDIPLPDSGIPGLDLGERDGMIAPLEFLSLFRPSQELRRRSAGTAFRIGGENVSGVQWGRLDRRLVFSGFSGREDKFLSYVATTTLDDDKLTILYIEARHPLDTFGMSYRQEVQLQRR